MLSGKVVGIVSYGQTAVAGTPAGERRDGPRRICRVRASVALPGHQPFAGVTIDIGRDGLALLLEHPLPSGTGCEVSFNVFAKGAVQRIQTKAQALNSVFVRDAVRVSFSFNHVSVEQQRMLSEFVGHGATR
jgi:hypothetical protein